MNSDNLKGKIKDVAGSVQRKAGEATGDNELEARGAANQAEGKTQNAWGNVKKEVRDLKDDVKSAFRKNDERAAEDRDIKRDDVA